MFDEINVPWDGWKIVKLIGKGSYGTVYEIERAIGSYVEKSAMKVISIPTNRQIIEDAYIDGYNEESITKMFSEDLDVIVDEYRIMEALSGNTNIVAVKDFAVIKHNDEIGWDVFIRMELLTPLSKLLKTRHLNMSEVYKLGMDICQALVLCEEKGLVHRDVKPENIFVTENGTFKLGDFGIARTLDHTTNATRAGTERYMAPEVIKRQQYGRDVDLYSIGLVLYWLLNDRRMPFLAPGKVPTAAEQNEAQIRRLTGEPLPLPANGTLAFKKIVLKACAYDRNMRYSSAKEMLRDLKHVSELSNNSLPTQYNSKVQSVKPRANYIEEKTGNNSWDDTYETVGKAFSATSIENKPELLESETIGVDYDHIVNDTQSNSNPEIVDSGLDNELKGKTIPSKSSSNRQGATGVVLGIECVLIVAAIIWVVLVITNSFNPTKNALSEIDSSGTITFGNIEWIVLSEEGDKTLLLSKDCVEQNAYNVDYDYEPVTWETCTLRSYLNGTWYEDTFSEEEKDKILTTNVLNSDNAEYGTSGGNDTEDKVFLLSIDEAEQYFSSDNERVAKFNGKADTWWLRESDVKEGYGTEVDASGLISYCAHDLLGKDMGVRPALWVNLNS